MQPMSHQFTTCGAKDPNSSFILSFNRIVVWRVYSRAGPVPGTRTAALKTEHGSALREWTFWLRVKIRQTGKIADNDRSCAENVN